MPLNIALLKIDIANAFNQVKDRQDNQQQAIDDLAEGIAAAVINHIKQNLQVTSQGTGYNGTPVISNSTNIS